MRRILQLSLPVISLPADSRSSFIPQRLCSVNSDFNNRTYISQILLNSLYIFLFLILIFIFTGDAMNNALNEFTGTVRRAVDDYNMIDEGDRIAVGVSGGKDSMLLLASLKHLQGYYPKRFELEAVTVELGFEGMDFTPVADFCADRGIPYTRLRTNIKEIVFDVRREDNPCSLCSKMRRGAINDAIRERGISKLALGHHFDDAVETFMMSLLMEGRLSCFRPVTFLDRSGVTQIRPLIYAGELKISKLAAELALPVVENPCPQDKASKRYEIKKLLASMSLEYPDMKSKIFGAMQRMPLPGWETAGSAK